MCTPRFEVESHGSAERTDSNRRAKQVVQKFHLLQARSPPVISYPPSRCLSFPSAFHLHSQLNTSLPPTPSIVYASPPNPATLIAIHFFSFPTFPSTKPFLATIQSLSKNAEGTKPRHRSLTTPPTAGAAASLSVRYGMGTS